MNSNSSQQDDVNSNYDELISESELFMTDEFFGENNESEPDDVIIVHMDIREPLRLLKTLLEEKIGVKLTEYTICLQEAQTLEPHKNLVDQCVRGEGLVQINSQVQTINKRINIVDVLKPSEDILEALTDNRTEVLALEDMIIEESHFSEPVDSKEHEEVNINKRFHNWAMDQKFKKEQARLNIPRDPALWTVPQVKHWLLYAVRQFNLKHIKLSNWNITGAELCAMTNAEFNVKVPYDPGHTFWTHLELLRQFKNVTTVTVARNNVNVNECQQMNDQTIDNQQMYNNQVSRVSPKIIRKSNSVSTANSSNNANECSSSSHMNVTYASSNNGQVQLWQFLLDILTDKTCTDIIQWMGGEGEFKLLDPERVAQLWGEKKNKPTMNYEKLSRALRYYYDGDMISKVPGKRFVYKFDCDLKLLIGYDALQLSRLVNESTQVVQFC